MLRASEQKIQWILLENRCFFENLRQDRLSRQIPNVSGYSIQSSGGGSYFSGGGGSNWRNNGGNDWNDTLLLFWFVDFELCLYSNRALSVQLGL